MIPGGKLFVMGRLKKIAHPSERRGHAVRARSEDRVLDTSVTDGSGRFLLEWNDDGSEGRVSVELITSGGGVAESVEFTRDDLESPPVVAFSGDGVVGSPTPSVIGDRRDRFEAEGDYPICVASSCQELTLNWICPEGSRVSILSGGRPLREGLPAMGLLKVTEASSARYTRRVWPAGSDPSQYSDRTLEVRRYPSLSLVLYGTALWRPGQGEFGASISCPAGSEGLVVTVKSSDAEMVPDFEIRILPGTTWATTRVPLGPRKGVVKVTASAPGYARDGVTFTLE
jgi:hypothetical protein